MKKLTPIFVIAGVIIVALFVVFACKNVLNNENIYPNPTVVPSVEPGKVTPEPTPAPTATPEGKPTAEPSQSSEPRNTTTPETTSSPTQEPTPAPTAVPTSTPAPTAAPEVKNGSFRSDTGTSINLRTDWSYAVKGDLCDVTIKVYLECYTISVSKRNDSTLTVNGQTMIFNTEEMKSSERAFHEYLLTEYSYVAPKGETVDFEAKWHFRGKYSGVSIESITAGGKFVLK